MRRVLPWGWWKEIRGRILFISLGEDRAFSRRTQVKHLRCKSMHAKKRTENVKRYIQNEKMKIKVLRTGIAPYALEYIQMGLWEFKASPAGHYQKHTYVCAHK